MVLDVKKAVGGFEFATMPKEEWRKLPAYVKEKREPTFWEVPLYTHFEKFMERAVSRRRGVEEALLGKRLATIRREPLGRVKRKKLSSPSEPSKEPRQQ